MLIMRFAAGLDVDHRPRLMNLLHALHTKRAPRVIMTLRAQDPIPEWATHVVRAEEGRIVGRERAHMVSKHQSSHTTQTATTKREANIQGKPLVEINGLNIAYHERKILTDINWTIREGDKWHLKGPNGL